MTRRTRTHTLALLGIAAAAAPAAKHPNILFCIADDASYAHFGANGCAWVKTPAFDRVAREGLLFTRAYTPNSKCAPSRAVVLTGRNSWQLESAANHGGYYPKGYTTFMEALGKNGYFAGFTAKGWAPGEPGKYADGKPRQLTGINYSNIKTTPPTDGISNIDYAANFEAFLKDWKKNPDTAGKPFAFWFGSHEPHRKYTSGTGVSLARKKLSDIDRVPPFWPDTEKVRNDMLDYALEIEYYDTQLARMIAALERAGELDNTLIVVTSDNGMPFPRYKGTTYEFSTHEPLAIRWPAGIKNPGRVINDYVSFIDFAPTFLEVAGLEPAAAGMMPVTGKTLTPIFRDDYAGKPVPGRDVLHTGQERHDVGRPDDTGYPVRGLFAGDYIYLHNFEPGRWPMCDPITGYLNTDGGPTKTAVLDENRRGINHWRWELDFGRRPADELYNLKTDPWCLNNLAADPAQAARLAAMRDQLYATLRAQHDPRMEGRGEVFDKYPHTPEGADFYNRQMKGEQLRANWVSKTDFESPDFDPERPLAPGAVAPARPAKPATPPAAQKSGGGKRKTKKARTGGPDEAAGSGE